MAIIARKMSTKDFDFQKDTKCFCAEASDLGRGWEHRAFSQIYDDAADSGFTLVNPVTGEEATFSFSHHDYSDQEKTEIAGWNFTIIPASVRVHPKCAGVTVLIIND